MATEPHRYVKQASVVCCGCGWAVRVVVVVAVDVAVCVRFVPSGCEKRSRVYFQNARVT